MTKFSKILLMLFISGIILGQKPDRDFIYFEVDDLVKLKNPESAVYEKYIAQIIEIADIYLEKTPVSIRSVKAPIEGAEPGDYFSESPYWWPDPDNPGGPYIRRDGERNPERFLGHKILLAKSNQAISSLSAAAFFTGEKKYADKAVEYIDNWFVNPAIRMNPHLKYAQLIRNRTRLRGVGIIETHRFTHLVEMINLLKQSNLVKKESLSGFNNWMNEYLNWLLESDYGIDERERGNNHSSWYAAQIAAISVYLQMYDIVLKQQDYVEHFLIDNQFNSECDQPFERARTKSLSYSCFNLNAQVNLAIIFKLFGLDTWNYKNKNSCTLQKAVDVIIPFVEEPDHWSGQQIYKMRIQPQNFIGLAGLNFGRSDLIKAHHRLQANGRTERVQYNRDPFEIILDAVIENRIINEENDG